MRLLIENLTPQQRRYVEARACGMNSSQAAKAAGVPSTNAGGLERSPTVQLAMKEINDRAMSEMSLAASRKARLQVMLEAGETGRERRRAERHALRIVTGIGVPQITAVSSVVEGLAGTDVPIISDGGIRYSGDIAKALANGRRADPNAG